MPPVDTSTHGGGSAIDHNDMGGGSEGRVDLTPKDYEPPLELPDGCHHISLEKFLEVNEVDFVSTAGVHTHRYFVLFFCFFKTREPSCGMFSFFSYTYVTRCLGDQIDRALCSGVRRPCDLHAKIATRAPRLFFSFPTARAAFVSESPTSLLIAAL